ncbi:hypothetical protein H6F38_14720 [Paenibacillus sp. EKM208P]|nr:hypothetical protein H6F38_14720 [Paenibacillus sp. EKM208P]
MNKRVRTLSINEMNILISSSALISTIMLLVFLYSPFCVIAALIVYCIFFFWIFKLLWMMFYSKWILKLPGKSILRTRKLIEVHVGDLAKNEASKFLSINSKSVLVAHQLKKDAVFYSWHRSPEKYKEFFGDCADIVTVEGFERFAQLFRNRSYKPEEVEYPLTRVYVFWNKLDDHTIAKLERHVKRGRSAA